MGLISRPSHADLDPERRQRWDAEQATHGMTHMKQTLLRSVPAFDALMTWYPLRDALVPFIGERGTIIVSHAISTTNECLICSLYFRRALADRGEDLSAHPLTEEEHDLEVFGRQVAAHGRADEEVTRRLLDRLGEEGLVLLVSFAGLMVATNIVNEALDVDPDTAALELFTGPRDEFSAFRAARVHSLDVLTGSGSSENGSAAAGDPTGTSGRTTSAGDDAAAAGRSDPTTITSTSETRQEPHD